MLILSLAALAVVLTFALLRPKGWTEDIAAVPASAMLIVIGALPLRDAVDEVTRLLPVVGFLAAVLVLAQLCDDEGVFRAAGELMARSSQGRSGRLLQQVFIIASVTTAVLRLDATVVLLTPVVLTTARTLRLPVRPHSYASAHLANTASLLLPVSNLTNLLAFASAGLSFTRFTALMAAPWLIAITAEYAIFRLFFAAELSTDATEDEIPPRTQLPVFVLALLAVTLAGFAVTSLLGVSPAWAACAGAAVLAGRGFVRRRGTLRGIVRAVNLPFLAFVLALGVVVRAVMVNGLDSAARDLIPHGDGLTALLALAAIAAVLANLVNNLPAVLLLLPLVADGGAASVLGRFTRLGLCTVPVTLVMAVLALWAGLRLIGT